MKAHTLARKAITFISIGIFIISLFQECFCASNTCFNSFVALAFGWAEICCGDIAAIAWTANIFLITSWVLTFINSRYATWCSVLSTLLCFVFFLDKKVILDEAGHFGAITAYKAGFALWVTSSVIMLTGNLVLTAIKTNSDR